MGAVGDFYKNVYGGLFKLTAPGLIKTYAIDKPKDRKDRSSRRRAHLAAEEKKEATRKELGSFHANVAARRGGGPGKPVVTGAEIAGGVNQIQSGATAREVLG